MAITRRNEVLAKAIQSDQQVVPRYNLVDAAGNVLAENVMLELQNPVIQVGTPVDKAVLDECLAASGVTEGTDTAFTLAQENFALFDGAVVRICFHVDSGATPTLNINNTGAKALMVSKIKPLKAGIAAGTWCTFIYSLQFDFFLQQGSGGNTDSTQSTFQRYLTQKFDVRRFY